MYRNTALTLAILISISSVNYAEPSDVFPGLTWGSNTDETVDAFGEPDQTGGTRTTYYVYRGTEVAGQSATLLVYFDEAGGFFGGLYLLGGYRRTVSNFEDIDGELRELYGAPTLAEVRGLSSPDEPYSWNDISRGEVALFSAWDIEGMTILHAALADDAQPGGITHQVFYLDPGVLSATEAFENVF